MKNGTKFPDPAIGYWYRSCTLRLHDPAVSVGHGCYFHFFHSFYLERYGNLSTTNLTFDYDKPGNSGNPRHRTAIINATGFENPITSGYFTTIEYPESKNPDFFILYYGTVKSGNLSQQTPYLKTLMKPFFDPGSIEQITGPV
jgi:hypothetical protein